MGANLVAIVGRPNVGKSTLFNRLTESRKAIVDEMEGVTRDRHYGYAEWGGVEFSVVDTGGYVHGSDDVFEGEIRKQVDIAVQEADAIMFVVDVTTGTTDLDITTANMLRKSGKPVFVVANKVDNNKLLEDISEFYSFGLGEIYALSAINGGGTGELLDDLIKTFPQKEIEKLDLPKIAIIGQPNVGKSSLTNTLIGYERTIVTPIAGTTRDTINTRYTAYGHDFFLVDTAGLRKKAKVKEDVEFYSVMRTIRALEDADVCLLMIDATSGGLGAQDMSIIHLVQKNKKGLVILVNKWDLVEKDHNSMKLFTEEIKSKIAPFVDVPIVFTSIPGKQRIFKALETAIEVYENRTRKIATSKLNKVLLPLVESYPPPSIKGKSIKIKYITQLPTHTPCFAFFCNLPQYIKEPYKRFLENKMREHFQLTGVPISIMFRSKDGDKD